MKKIYSKRIWLNVKNSPSTGSVVAYHGPISYGNGEKENATFLEIASCHEKSRLHKSGMDTMDDFIKKMDLLRDTINDFVIFLRENK